MKSIPLPCLPNDRAGENGCFGEDIPQPPMKYYFDDKVRYTSMTK